MELEETQNTNNKDYYLKPALTINHENHFNSNRSSFSNSNRSSFNKAIQKPYNNNVVSINSPKLDLLKDFEFKYSYEHTYTSIPKDKNVNPYPFNQTNVNCKEFEYYFVGINIIHNNGISSGGDKDLELQSKL